MSIKDRIVNLAREKRFISSVDIENLKQKTIMEAGYCVKGLLTFDRRARDLVTARKLRRVEDKDFKEVLGFSRNLAVYEYITPLPDQDKEEIERQEENGQLLMSATA